MSSPSSRPWPASLFLGLLSILSAFLLFQVQPVISKFILPWFGGSPGVWTTCLVFFQTVLFAGYTYAHLLGRLRPKTQAIVHSALLLAAVAFLPISPADAWKPSGDEDPAGQIFMLLLATVGLPYFVLSSTSPLTQVWFTRARPGSSPWKLYALSNIGSLAALLSYPFFFEPQFEVTVQTWLWSGAFCLFAGMSAGLAWKTRHTADATGAVKAAEDEVPVPWWHRLLWVLLPALASAMLMATTNHVCQDVAVVPFMWVVPLSLYLLTFIICFERERWYVSWLWALLALLVVLVTAGEKKFGGSVDITPTFQVEVILCFSALFLICMVCHGELARLKPAPSRLTEFYLLMSAGGALGGMFVSLVAPRIFVTFTEWPLGLIASLAVAGFALIFGLWRVSFPWLLILTAAVGLALLVGDQIAMKAFQKASPTGHTLHLLYQSLHSAMAQNVWLGRRVDFLVFAYLVVVIIRLFRARGRNGLHLFSEAAVLSVLLPALLFLCRTTLPVEPQPQQEGDRVRDRVRNFYGTMHVEEDYDTGLDSAYRTLTHGTIVHGIQNLGDLYREEPITYYGRDTGIGRALSSLSEKPDARVGVVGLGAGTVACYARAGHQFRFYEINPDVVRLARKHFTYMSDAEKRGAGISTIIGDARLVLEREPAQQFDVLLLDAFSGDAIPMHLLTREAFQIYQRHMKPDGIIAVHVTNSYLMLAPVVEKQAEAMGWQTTRVITDADGDDDSTDYVLVTQNQAFLKAVPAQRPPNEPRLKLALWTDRYHNLFQILLREEKAEPDE